MGLLQSPALPLGYPAIIHDCLIEIMHKSDMGTMERITRPWSQVGGHTPPEVA